MPMRKVYQKNEPEAKLFSSYELPASLPNNLQKKKTLKGITPYISVPMKRYSMKQIIYPNSSNTMNRDKLSKLTRTN